jgi:hypothetical protein
VINVKRAVNRRKLKNFILNKKQLTVVIISTVYCFLSLTAILTVIIAPVYSDIFHSNAPPAQREAAKVFMVLSEKMAIALAAYFVFTIVPLIWATHRVFGPLINFTNIFQKVAGGDLKARVRLRRGDLLKSEADRANDMIQSLAITISEAKLQNHCLVATLNEMVEGRCQQKSMDDTILKAQKQARACETLLSKLRTAELSDRGQSPDCSPETSLPKSYSSNNIKDLEPSAIE